MGKILKEILDWSEVWALLIPLAILVLKKNKLPFYLKPVQVYIYVALVLNIIIDLISKYKIKWGLGPEDLLWNNNFLYNIQSVLRLFLFAWFFILLRQRFMNRIKAFLPFLFLIFLLVNFFAYEKFIPRGNNESFSSRLLATESALLLFYCLQYFIFLVIEDKATPLSRRPGFWVVAGLSVYVAVSFFIFLFYDYLVKVTWDFAVGIWDVHNIVFIILCICLAKQFSLKNE